MTDQELARCLGRALNSLGVIEGTVLAMQDIVLRELGEDYMSVAESGGLNKHLQSVRSDLLEAMGALNDAEAFVHPNDGSM